MPTDSLDLLLLSIDIAYLFSKNLVSITEKSLFSILILSLEFPFKSYILLEITFNPFELFSDIITPKDDEFILLIFKTFLSKFMNS